MAYTKTSLRYCVVYSPSSCNVDIAKEAQSFCPNNKKNNEKNVAVKGVLSKYVYPIYF